MLCQLSYRLTLAKVERTDPIGQASRPEANGDGRRLARLLLRLDLESQQRMVTAMHVKGKGIR